MWPGFRTTCQPAGASLWRGSKEARAPARSLELGVPATVFPEVKGQGGGRSPMVAVMIGIDPHKASHTAVAINAAEEPLGQWQVRASAVQVERLLAAGERVLDVPPKLSARVRLLEAGDTNKNDPNDARPAAVAALRSRGVREASRDDHAAVLKVWSKRHRDLGRARTQVACRLHAVLCELVPGGVSKAISAAQAGQLLERISPSGAAQAARCELAAEFLADLRRIDAQMRDAKKKLTAAVRACGTT